MLTLRPTASEIGPTKKVPTPMPSTKADKTSCARFSASGDSSAPICGSAGSIASIEKASVAKRSASMPVNSTGDRRAGDHGLFIVNVF